jgi:hypothetical protein
MLETNEYNFLAVHRHDDFEILLSIVELPEFLELIWEDCLKDLKLGSRYLAHFQKIQNKFGGNGLIYSLTVHLFKLSE